MCDYSLHHVKTRDAAIGDKLITHNFGTGTVGFKAVDDHEQPATAVCVRPGSEIAFDDPIVSSACPLYVGHDDTSQRVHGRVAVFSRNDDPGMSFPHHRDALEFPDGTKIKLASLVLGQRAHVLTTPAVAMANGQPQPTQPAQPPSQPSPPSPWPQQTPPAPQPSRGMRLMRAFVSDDIVAS